MPDRIALAARNNALWCDAVCRSHGISGTLDPVAWSSPTRTPPLYPDAVTLAARTSEDHILLRIDASDGASVKDSWASLDLASVGFSPVIAGQWVWRRPEAPEPAPADGRAWRTIGSAEEMRRWTQAWAADPDEVGILAPAILDESDVHVLAAAEGDDDFAAGCIVNVTGEVAGLTNVFSADEDQARTWRGAVAAAAAVAPGLSVVAWESSDGVELARSAGFEVIGPLTVWIR